MFVYNNMRSYKKKSRGISKKYIMKGCSKTQKCLGGGTNSIVYPNKGPIGKYPGWLNSQGGGCGGLCLQKGGNNGLPYGKNLAPMKAPPVSNGLTGKSWGSNFKWPGANRVSGDYNHISYNKYFTDVSRAMKNIGANFPFLKGGKSKKNISRKNRNKKGGGFFENTIMQDGVNAFNKMIYGANDTYNAIAGKSNTAVNPMPQNQPKILRNYK